MEREESIFPQIDLFPRAAKVARFIFGSMEAPLHMSNHYDRSHFEPTDGEAYQPTLPFDLQEGIIEVVSSDTEMLKDLILRARIAREARQG